MLFNSIINPADRGGCGHYRCLFPSWAIQSMRKDIKISDYSYLSPAKEIFLGQRLVRVQRQVSDYQAEYFLKMLIPMSKSIGFWLAYEIDDVIHRDHIPRYNPAWATFQNDRLMNNIQTILNNVDFLTVTTEILGNYYNKYFNVSKEKILVIPNFLPLWWIGENYSLDRMNKQYDEHTKKRIGFISSASHIDIRNQNNGNDDFTHIIPFIEQNIEKYDFVFVGTYPRQLKKYLEDKKISFYPGFDVLNYPRLTNNLNLDLIIAPLQDNIFNAAKSNLKAIEPSSMGIPVVLQDNKCYETCPMPKFNNCNDLQNEVDRILGSKDVFLDEIKRNRDFVDNDTTHDNHGWWLEHNIYKWINFYTLSQKTIHVNLENIKLSNKVFEVDKNIPEVKNEFEEVRIDV